MSLLRTQAEAYFNSVRDHFAGRVVLFEDPENLTIEWRTGWLRIYIEETSFWVSAGRGFDLYACDVRAGATGEEEHTRLCRFLAGRTLSKSEGLG